MKDTHKKQGGKGTPTRPPRTNRKFKEPQSPAEFRRRVKAVFKRATAHTVDQDILDIFNELADILCAAYERGGLPEVRHVWAEAKRVVFKREGKR